MLIGKVISTVVATSKHPGLHGLKLLLIQPYMNENSQCYVAADMVGAGVGQLVLISQGEPAAEAHHKKIPVDAAVIGILDNEPVIGL